MRERERGFGASGQHGGNRVAELAPGSEVIQDGVHVAGDRLKVLHLAAHILLDAQNLAIDRSPVLHFDIDQLKHTSH